MNETQESKPQRERSPEERLAWLNEERKNLRVQVRDEKTQRLAAEAKAREGRAEKLNAVNQILQGVLDEIYAYKKLGSVKKNKTDVISSIIGILTKPVTVEASNE